MESPFLDFFKYWPKRSKKKFRIEIWTFSFQICFQNQFSTLGSGQTENTRIREYVYFQFDHLPKSKIDFKADLKWECPYFCSKFFFWAFWSVFQKVKKSVGTLRRFKGVRGQPGVKCGPKGRQWTPLTQKPPNWCHTWCLTCSRVFPYFLIFSCFLIFHFDF